MRSVFMKKMMIIACLTVFGMSTYAEIVPNSEVLPYINGNRQFSGAQNTSPKSIPAFSKSVYDYQEEAEDTPKPVVREAKQIKKDITPQSPSGRKPPMTYDRFPQNYDSSNSMMMMQQYGMMPGMF